MMSTIPVAGTVSLSKTKEDSKERILFTLQIAVKQIQHHISLQNEESELSSNVHEVKQLCESLDKALFHGLKCFDKGYWSFVKEFTHKNTIKLLEELDNVHTELQYGRAWLCLALNEASLESYFRSFMQNSRVIKKHYALSALLCDEQRMQLVLMLMAGLEYVPININLEVINFGNGLSFFENHSSENPLLYKSPKKSPSKISKVTNVMNSYELVTLDNAVEVTSDFKDSIDTSSCKNQGDCDNVSTLHKSNSELENSDIKQTVSQNDLELISHYINIDAESDIKVSSDLEVVRTKVVRRIKKSSSQIQCQSSKAPNNDVESQYVNETNVPLENRLSKATTDSGLYLDSSDSELTDATDEIGTSDDGLYTTFEVGDFCHDISVTFSTPKVNKLSSETKIEERGIPEGQEDPVENSSLCNKGANRSPLQSGNDGLEVNNDEEVEEEEEELSIYDLCKISPASEKFDKGAEETSSITMDSANSDVKSVSSTNSSKSLVVDVVSEELAKLALEKPEDLDLSVGNNIQLYFLVEVYEHEEEAFFKLYYGYTRFSEGLSERVYFLLSNKSVYFLKPGNNHQKFFKLGSLRYSSIDYITVGLNYQNFKLISRNREHYSLYTASEELTREILSNLEIGIRRFIPKLPLPTVYTDATAQMITIQKFLASVFNCEKTNVVLNHFVLARWEDYTSSSVTPYGPIYQDYLMYRHVFAKENKATQWQPGYFFLKGGVLYCMENEKSNPQFFIQMCAPHCKGCRRIHLRRPHTFEILHSNSDSLQLAAADNYESSKWLQCFLETVSMAGHVCVYGYFPLFNLPNFKIVSRQFIDNERSVQQPCCIMFANDKIVISQEEPRKCTFKLLSKASICDLVTIFVDPIASNFVMLEFEIAEASKSSGEWIISFESVIEKDKFIDIVSHRWSNIFQVSLTIEKFKDIYQLKKYRQISEELKAEKKELQDFCMDNFV